MFRTRLTIFLFVISLVALAPAFSQSQLGTDPIDKTGLLETLRERIVQGKTLIAHIRRRGVSFKMTREDEAEIRLRGKYLGELGLDNLITAIRSSYRATKNESPVIKQEMKDSPGSVQAGGNVTINQGDHPRRLTPDQEGVFVNVLRNNPKGRVSVTCIESGGPEPCQFARQLASLLESKEAGWIVDFSPIMFGAGDPAKTIPELYLEAQSNSPPTFAFALKAALKAVLGHDPPAFLKPDSAPDFLQLTVWFKSSDEKLKTGDAPRSNQTMTNSPGGIQAGRDVNIVDIPPPKVFFTELAKNEPLDGKYRTVYRMTIDSKVRVINIMVRVDAPTILDLEPAGGMGLFGHTGHRDGWAFTNIPNAYGSYDLIILTKQPDNCQLSYRLN